MLAMLGLSDIEVAQHVARLASCGKENVEFRAVKLATQLKGHLREREVVPAATEIHLHVMESSQPQQKQLDARVLDVNLGGNEENENMSEAD